MLFLALALLAVAILGSGCGGVNASGSVSPATFLLPGLMQNTPSKEPLTEPAAAEPNTILAQSR
jgi:hypothetical protein